MRTLYAVIGQAWGEDGKVGAWSAHLYWDRIDEQKPTRLGPEVCAPHRALLDPIAAVFRYVRRPARIVFVTQNRETAELVWKRRQWLGKFLGEEDFRKAGRCIVLTRIVPAQVSAGN